MTFISRLQKAARQRAEYRRTLWELRGLTPRQSEDLGIYPGDERRIARAAVYG
ncbi:hypothetical protein ruthe_01130 [Rubellimicrobium thermophilum DSM 16684]|uniref:YjiS-like domain-containing protein n=1 Tax=Rubellimicrobium thermophilum DSM 16684 TaxID=1123069 RepID=S9QY55_9RHOB|nr:DUF1127 domain-containing protein [Rubellimicrobium thermophilum]EPX86316.1 hypothetical protein ruthe_01130 [Rubellimicrobium thermophilum DSM 16684]